MTKWWKPAEKLPSHNEQVLVRMGDIIELALYDGKVFKLVNGVELKPTEKFFWMELLRAEGM